MALNIATNSHFVNDSLYALVDESYKNRNIAFVIKVYHIITLLVQAHQKTYY
jgi:hypothetical protein